MGVNKVVFGAVSIMDISDSTVTPGTLAKEAVAYGADGERIVGTMEAGVDTSDATATAADMAKGKTAYVNGEKVTGTIQEVLTGEEIFYSNSGCSYPKKGTKNDIEIHISMLERLVRTNSYVTYNIPIDSNFGDATAADVAKGKTFTSAAGYQVEGTMEASSGGLPAVITAGDTPILGSWSGKTVTNTTPTDTGLSVTIPKDGTYRFKVCAYAASSYARQQPSVYLYKNGSQASSKTLSTTAQTTPWSVDLECAAGDVISVWGAAAGSSYSKVSPTAMALVACVEM